MAGRKNAGLVCNRKGGIVGRILEGRILLWSFINCLRNENEFIILGIQTIRTMTCV